MERSKELNNAIVAIANCINNKTNYILDREYWEEKTDDLVEEISNEIYECLELMWVDRQ